MTEATPNPVTEHPRISADSADLRTHLERRYGRVISSAPERHLRDSPGETASPMPGDDERLRTRLVTERRGAQRGSVEVEASGIQPMGDVVDVMSVARE